MKNVLVGILVVLIVTGTAFSQESQPQADLVTQESQPQADLVTQESQPQADLVTVEGRIVLGKSADGKDIYIIIASGLVDMVLVDGPVLQELLKVEKFLEKTFILEGKKVLADDFGKTDTFVISSFEEDVHDHGHDGHDHGHDDHDHGDSH